MYILGFAVPWIIAQRRKVLGMLGFPIAISNKFSGACTAAK
jgi:hypothetical protein